MRAVRVLCAVLLLAAISFLFVVPVLEEPTRLGILLATRPPHRLPVPVDGVRPSQLANSWEAPRSGNRTHQGIDIFAKRNTPVRSATEGMVLRVGMNRLGGRIVTVLGPGGQVHYYAHLERHGTLKPKDWVYPGDLIGYVGDSGNARGTPTHLHYGIYTPLKGAINPYPLLTATEPLPPFPTV